MYRYSPTVSSPSSALSISSCEDGSGSEQFNQTSGTHKVHYKPHQQWDYLVAAEEHPIDLSLMLPHYRAHNQPIGHRMGMYLHSERHEIKARVGRKSLHAAFFLSVHASSAAPVTLYLPSDFSGVIRIPSCDSSRQKISLSAGFSNHILPRVRFMSSSSPHTCQEAQNVHDEVEIFASGPITLRMWNVVDGMPEKATREVFRRLLKCASSTHVSGPPKAKDREQQRVIDWDFLLED
ncbi:hypothetical protein EWM64_g9670 [Hericium alpestre]|uniref:DUF7330 domain-containing protein n=1 Tax=Hericium alpestre TaxID=135208 RepID=A0A4Y9ZI67_9AGAM|nr:hypothetical protein EWM64_g9670 [Hericium alpestre]